MLRCSECKKPIVSETKHTDWLQLFHFINFLFSEGYIEQATRDSMLDALMSLKDFAFENQKGETHAIICRRKNRRETNR